MSKYRRGRVSGFVTVKCFSTKIVLVLGFAILLFSVLNEAKHQKQGIDVTSYSYISNTKGKACGNENFKILCAGTIIYQHYILTSASCVNNRKLFINVGMLRVFTAATIEISSAYKHSGYTTKKSLIRNDIAVLKPVRKIVLSKYVAKAEIPKKYKEIKPNTKCHSILMKSINKREFNYIRSNMTIVTSSKCNINGKNELCVKPESKTGYKLNGTALWCPEKNTDGTEKIIFTGLISRFKNEFIIFTKIEYYLNWIEWVTN